MKIHCALLTRLTARKTRFFHVYICTRCLRGFSLSIFSTDSLNNSKSIPFPAPSDISEMKISILTWSTHPCVRKGARHFCDISCNITRREWPHEWSLINSRHGASKTTRRQKSTPALHFQFFTRIRTSIINTGGDYLSMTRSAWQRENTHFFFSPTLLFEAYCSPSQRFLCSQWNVETIPYHE